MENQVIYLASPYSHPEEDIRLGNFDRVSKLAAELCAQGANVFSPITYGHTLLNFKRMPSDWAFWQDFCFAFLRKADKMIVYMMPGWDKSRGVSEEINLAKELGIEIEYVDYKPDITVIGDSAPYLARLVKEWCEHDKIIIACDFDDTIFPWRPELWKPNYERTLKAIREARELGAYVVIFTASAPERYDQITDYCKGINFEFDTINTNVIKLPYGNNGKVYANIFIDDRAGINEALTILEDATSAVKKIKTKIN